MALRESPVNIDEHNWYYEEQKQIIFVHEIYSKGEYVTTDQVPIPWKRLLESVRRKYPSLFK